MGGWAKGAVAVLTIVALAPAQAAAQQTVVQDDEWCDQSGSHGDMERTCEVRETTFRPTGGTIDVLARPNGGIKVEGWDRNEIRVRALVQAWAESEDDARRLMGQVEVKASGYDGGESSVKTLTSGGVIDDMNVTLHAAADLRGILVARGGGVVSGARVTVVKDPGEGADQGRRWRMWGGGTIAFTDEKGRFHAADVPVGDLLVRIEAEGLATETVSRKGVEPGEKITGWRITVRPALEITGKLLGPDGEPMRSAFIQAKQTASPDGEPSAETYGARVQAGGVFLIRNIPEGSYTLTVRTWGRDGGSRYEPLERPGVAAGTEGLTLQMVAKE